MATKKFQKGTTYAKYDLDGDGEITDEELEPVSYTHLTLPTPPYV